MCLGEWGWMGFVKLNDIKAVAMLSEVQNDDKELAANWDSISSIA